eukprot:GFYU01031504.1.p1 GENE.GFYU01031504.1~~GFYU01031504.1.p1  ORF type:complete len:151 (-),score=34.82 GFYU01031504.1:11-463(-)
MRLCVWLCVAVCLVLVSEATALTVSQEEGLSLSAEDTKLNPGKPQLELVRFTTGPKAETLVHKFMSDDVEVLGWHSGLEEGWIDVALKTPHHKHRRESKVEDEEEKTVVHHRLEKLLASSGASSYSVQSSDMSMDPRFKPGAAVSTVQEP